MELSFHHICIETDTYAESLDFYTRLLGFEVVEESPLFHGRAFNSWLKNGELLIELQTPKPGIVSSAPQEGSRGLKHFCFVVKNLEPCIAELEAKGFHSFLDAKRLYEVEGRKLCKLLAPEGTIIELREGCAISPIA
jgi:glyoxylase I family protein